MHIKNLESLASKNNHSPPKILTSFVYACMVYLETQSSYVK